MNKILAFAAMAVSAAVIVSCGGGELKTEKVNVIKVESLVEGQGASIKVNAFVEYPISGLSSEVIAKVNEFIVGAAFGSDYAGLDVKAAAGKWADGCIANYKETNSALLEDLKGTDADAAVDNLGVLNWEFNLNAAFGDRYKDYLSYVVQTYVFTGGAHGSSSESAFVLDSTTGEVVPEEKFFVDGYKEQLSSLLTSHLSDAIPDPDDQAALFIKDIEPNGNFLVSEGGVTYIYGQYEIGPYYLGIIRVDVPWSELEGLVRETK